MNSVRIVKEECQPLRRPQSEFLAVQSYIYIYVVKRILVCFCAFNLKHSTEVYNKGEDMQACTGPKLPELSTLNPKSTACPLAATPREVTDEDTQADTRSPKPEMIESQYSQKVA